MIDSQGRQLSVNRPDLLKKTLDEKTPIHHICTDKNCLSTANGGPWTPLFKEFFDNAGLSFNDAANKVKVIGHQGPHPKEYFAGAVSSGAASPLFKTTSEAMRFNAGIGMATGIANGGDGLKEGGLAAGATYGVAKVSNPIKASIVSEAIQKLPVIFSSSEKGSTNEK